MLENLSPEQNKALVKALGTTIWALSFWVVSLVGFILAYFLISNQKIENGEQGMAAANESISASKKSTFWLPPSESTLKPEEKEMVLYGKELIVNTALYFGPIGKVEAHATNGMNCQNCHLEAGTKIFGNNYGAVAATYPKYRARSGKMEDINKRINDCFERSLNGEPLKTDSKEMQAMTAYILWLGKEVKKGTKPEGAGFKELAFLPQAADPVKGKVAYIETCQVCHGAEGQGQKNPASGAFLYPPLWGKNSYNLGAGLYRISNFARYIKYNMPLGVTHEKPQISDEEAWNIAAFVNSQSRPKKDITMDWPKQEEKPIDYAFGPFADGFSETQHKFGPFGPIQEARKNTIPTGVPKTKSL